jgi:hypothetical protein
MADTTDYPSALAAGFFGKDTDPVLDDTAYTGSGTGVTNLPFAWQANGGLVIQLNIPLAPGDHNVDIDWGDGSAAETLQLTPLPAKTHTYPAAGGHTVQVYSATCVGKTNVRVLV